MAYHPPSGPPPYYGYPPPPSSAPGAFAYIPAPVLMPYPENNNPTYVTNYIYPPQPTPEPILIIDHVEAEVVDWVPVTPNTAQSLFGRAFLAGREGWDNSPLWAIRAHHNGNLVPGKMAIKHRAAYIPFGGREVPIHNFEVLCAPQLSLQWVPMSHGQVPSEAVQAGNSHDGEPLYLGRVRHKGSLTPGKVQPSHSCCYISYGGVEIQFQQYEVLCYVEGYNL